jgi:hypothetical protein
MTFLPQYETSGAPIWMPIASNSKRTEIDGNILIAVIDCILIIVTKIKLGIIPTIR